MLPAQSSQMIPEENPSESRARYLAEGHRLTREGASSYCPRAQLGRHERHLRAAYRLFATAPVELRARSYAADWLLDNFYVIERAIRQIRIDLPVGYYYRLPKLVEGKKTSFPRVYLIARELIHGGLERLDLAQVERFLIVYQEITPLTMGEIWALPTMLRLVLIELLDEAFSRLIVSGRIVQLPAEALAEVDMLAANCVNGLQALERQDWKIFFERVNRVERVLRQDPAGVYAHMDAGTRDRYRHVVEEIARLGGYQEELVAQRAIELAREKKRCLSSNADAELPRSAHVGYYLLVQEGREELERRLGYSPSWRLRFLRFLKRHALMGYLGGIAFLALLFLSAILSYALAWGNGAFHLFIAAALALIPLLTLSVDLVNWLITHTIAPHPLPRLNFQEEGIPPECRTMVVIPCLLSSLQEISSLLKQLELHYLSNPDPNLGFALLTDFPDAPQQHMPEDKALLAQARAGIEALNRQHGGSGGGPFYLFHRERLWNPSEGCWMGWERKRGKLAEFNRLLVGEETSYSVKVGNLQRLLTVRYVLTLDADTILPRDSAARLVATLAHPLNRPEFDPDGGKLVAGYTVLQPRLEVQPTALGYSRFVRIFAGDSGVDLYSCVVSDVYQDLFGEGNYAGKGIYEVAAFRRVLQGRVPENALLSHDLFEGAQGRAGLVSDTVLYEDYPPHYLAYMHRMHRWVRGDWQLLPWLLPRVPHQGPGKIPNPLSPLARWKMLDNLRRSLLAPTVFAWLLAGWLWLSGPALVWTCVALTPLAAPMLSGLLTVLRQRMRRAPIRPFLPSWRLTLWRALITIAVLPYEALFMLDAILTTLHRLYISHEHLLQWVTYAHTMRLLGRKIRVRVAWREMSAASLLSLLVGWLVLWLRPGAFLVAAPLTLVWFLSPYLVYWLGRPVLPKARPLSEEEERCLRRLARRTWLFFERFVGPDDQWLPPDHFQEKPRGTVAHHTSPTNIGLYLLSALAAWDFGYISPLDFMLRLMPLFENLTKMERIRGHWLNWYDTRDLKPLPPRYISTVDSGNLAVSLVVLKEGCQAMSQSPLLSPQRWQGFLDTLDVFMEVIEACKVKPALKKPVRALLEYLARIRQRVVETKDSARQWNQLLCDLKEQVWPEVGRLSVTLVEAGSAHLSAKALSELRLWSDALYTQLERMQNDAKMFLPWLCAFQQLSPVVQQAIASSERLSAAWEALEDALPLAPRLAEIPSICKKGREHLQQLAALFDEARLGEGVAWCEQLEQALYSAQLDVNTLLGGAQQVRAQIDEFLHHMDFQFLFDQHLKIFHLGYHVESEALDSNHYGLLASESHLASLWAIAKGDVPQSHWMHLSRPLTRLSGERVLLSWGGTMFEYLMPVLFTHHYPNSLLRSTVEAAVNCQIHYGRQKGIPWGISESGYYRFDAALRYQYRGFGVPGLGLKAGLEEDLVVAPYASLLALPFQPQAVLRNIERLKREGAFGTYGFYEAVDYTADHLPSGKGRMVVYSYMAHHQGMILLSLCNFLHGEVMIRRFHLDRRVQSVELLLQEEMSPWAPLEFPNPQQKVYLPLRPKPLVELFPWQARLDFPYPQAHLLSNGHYSVVITQRGGGYSLWNGLSLTRWRSDTTCDPWGQWIYIRDMESGEIWSATQNPTATLPQSQNVWFHAHMAEFSRRDRDISSRLEVVVDPNADVEIRRLTLVNHSQQPRNLHLVSYAEIVLGKAEDDRLHPAFQNLFVESEYLPDLGVLLFHRRTRSEEEPQAWLAHLLVCEDENCRLSGGENERGRFIGRGCTPRQPLTLQSVPGWSQIDRYPLDPVFSLSGEANLSPYATVRLAFVTLAAATRQEVLELAQQYARWSWLERAFARAHMTTELELYRRGLSIPEVECAQKLLSLLLYPRSALRPPSPRLASNLKGQSALWAHGISGDHPILLVYLYDTENLDLVQTLLKIQSYWRECQIKVDLVLLNRRESGYEEDMGGMLYRLLKRLKVEIWLNRAGGIFLVRADQTDPADLILLESAARLILDNRKGNIEEQLKAAERIEPTLPPFIPMPSTPLQEEATPPLPRPESLLFDHGLGGFTADGKEYVIYLEAGQHTPAPWINVVANPGFGFVVSESGGGYTWAGNSSENRLTPWRNDAVSDLPGEALYLRDEETGLVWSPTPMPIRETEPYLIRHGAGYSIFEHHSNGLKQRLRLFVAPEAPLKIVHLRLENTWSRTRRITATFYVEWVLGSQREINQPYILPEFSIEPVAILARNPYHEKFGEWVAFLAASKLPHGLTTDRLEFLGCGGDYAHPAALWRIGLTNNVRAGDDPCAAIQLHFDIPPHAPEEAYFLLGQGTHRAHALELIGRYQDPTQVESAWNTWLAFWDDLLGRVQVETPDPALNLLLNRWLLYQTLSCRLWGRTALYQSSGAFGYRDQLQDSLALLHVAPQITRAHILEAASHQFEEGDVLHWWHPGPNQVSFSLPGNGRVSENIPSPGGRVRGVRTRCSDDLLWLPFAVAHYLTFTGDESLLHERVPFLYGFPLEEGEMERYGDYTYTEAETLYRHCLQALERGMTRGPHGLPLIGSGDWNDGLNRVGIKGQGESVWLGWFLYATLLDFAAWCERLGEVSEAEYYRQWAKDLHFSLEQQAWDGEWYRRAYDDDGFPLGSSINEECQIDSLAQSWAVLVGAAPPARAQQALLSAFQRLVRPQDRLVLLFSPPFNKARRNLGYIQAYPPGIRENGGQYTHAAIWLGWAFAEIGDGERAAQIFQILNPILRTNAPDEMRQYRLEPYVVAADIYSIPPHTGRGGWSWYTGSAAWMYRLGLEAILGIRRKGNIMEIRPCIPPEWSGYQVNYRFGNTTYQIHLENPEGVSSGVVSVWLDGERLPGAEIPLLEDGLSHLVRVILGRGGKAL